MCRIRRKEPRARLDPAPSHETRSASIAYEHSMANEDNVLFALPYAVDPLMSGRSAPQHFIWHKERSQLSPSISFWRRRYHKLLDNSEALCQ